MSAVILCLILIGGFGAGFCFAGRKLFYPLMATLCFLGGVIICTSLLGNSIWSIVAGLALGVGLANLSCFFYKVTLAIEGAWFGFYLGFFVVNFFPAITSPFTWIIHGLIALLLAFLFVMKSNLFIIIATAGSGAFTLATTAIFLFKNIAHLSDYVYVDGIFPTIANLIEYITGSFTTENVLAITIMGIVLFIAGTYFQMSSSTAQITKTKVSNCDDMK